MSDLRISAKDLGQLAMPNFCPRCFWMKRHVKALPFQVFPGIFSSIDTYTKKVTNEHYSLFTRVPSWFNPFGEIDCPVKAPSAKTFFVVDADTGVKLTGAPDEVLRMRDGSYFIADYKTARLTKGQDELMPMYDVQLNGYAYIGNRTSFDPVTGIGLIYFEPQTDMDSTVLPKILYEDGFNMLFRAKLHPVELNPDGMIPPLLHKARDVYELPKAPEGSEGCEDCERTSALMALLNGL